jgi:hypothetical protein
MLECSSSKHCLSVKTAKATASDSAVRLMQRLLMMYVGGGGK